MSIALERLSADERRQIAESLLTKQKLTKDGELGSHCPFHKESSPGGAFHYHFVEDWAYCLSCGTNSDLVGIFNAVHGRDVDDSEGCKEFVKTYCPDSSGSRTMPQPRQPQQKHGWQPNEFSLPSELWQTKAESFVEHSIERLQQNEEQLAELAKFGISAEVAKLCKFGWNDMDKWPPVTAWGLPHQENENGKIKKIWLPEGLVMPAVREGRVIKLKVRRPNPETPWGDIRKYWEVKGGANNLYHVYGLPSTRIWVLVETERDAAMVWALCHDMSVGAIGNGGASKRPCEFVTGLLRRAKVILNALDYDPAGATNTYKFWETEFPNSKRYPSPPSMGKDVGEAFCNGLDVRRWVWEGLPNFAKRFVTSSLNPKSETSVQTDTPQAETPAEKSHYEQVLEWMEPWPKWRQELINFFDLLRAAEFGVYRYPDGSILMGLKDNNWEKLHADESRRTYFNELRSLFHSPRELDAELGVQALADIVTHYFGDYLEYRND